MRCGSEVTDPRHRKFDLFKDLETLTFPLKGSICSYFLHYFKYGVKMSFITNPKTLKESLKYLTTLIFFPDWIHVG